MENFKSSAGQDEDMGTWHPARRPNGNTSHLPRVSPASAGTEDAWNGEADVNNPQTPQSVKMGKQRLPDMYECECEGEEGAAMHAQEQSDLKLSDHYRETHDFGEEHDLSLTESSLSPDTLGTRYGYDDSSGIPYSILCESSRSKDHEHIAEAIGLPENDMRRNKIFKSHASTDTRELRKEMDHAWQSEPECKTSYHATSEGPNNSFPDVPPLEQLGDSSEDVLPTSHEDHVISGPEHAAGSHRNFDELFPHHPASQVSGEVLENSMKEDGGVIATSMGVVQSSEAVRPLDDEEARYEEGVPLVPTHSIPESISPSPAKIDDLPKKISQTVEGEDEVNKSQNATPPIRPSPIDRKNTTQVIEAIDFPSHKASLESLKITADTSSVLEENNSPLPDILDGGFASQTSLEQQIDSGHPEPRSDDLAELWKAALGDDLLLEETDLSLDPASFFEDDGEGFLDDDIVGMKGEGVQVQENLLHDLRSTDGTIVHAQVYDNMEQAQVDFDRSLSSAASSVLPESTDGYNQNRPVEKLTSHVSQPTNGLRNSASAPNGFGRSESHHYSNAQTRFTPPPIPLSTQSFADKSKGGYTSPYDLPMDVSRPRKRNLGQQFGQTSTTQNAGFRPPPPRSSSMFTGSITNTKAAPPSSNLADSQSERQLDNSKPSMPDAKPSSGKFFEELPSSKSRPSAVSGRYAPQTAPVAPLQSNVILQQHGTAPQAAQAPSSGSQAYQLLPPEKMSLYGSPPPQQPPSQIVAATNPRYSPAPNPPSNVPPPRHRYASSPFTGSQASPPQTLPFQPRTSSPLARSISVSNQSGFAVEASSSDPRDVDQVHRPDVLRPPVPRMPSRSYQDHANYISGSQQARDFSPLLSNARYAPHSDSRSSSSPAINTPETDRLSSDGPVQQVSNVDPAMVDANNILHLPPRRSQTQSPDSKANNLTAPSRIQPNLQRSASFNERYEPQSVQVTAAMPTHHVDRGIRELPPAAHYLPPTDGRERDPLERWRGCPLVAFGFGGHVVTFFPKHVPRYTSGQKVALLKCSPGEIKVQRSNIFRLEDSVTTFPGPLKSKSKKKEVLEWLQKRIIDLEHGGMPVQGGGSDPDAHKGHEEKILLWKTVKILVEHDGLIDGNLVAERTLRMMLSPEIERRDGSANPVADANTVGILRRSSAGSTLGAISQEAMEALRHLLLHGDREKAVWHAVDNCMWPHALLLSSTLEQSVWRQVCSEFIRQEVKPFGENTEPLAAIFQIFAGSGDESMDELVPPSARAGLQMVSKITSMGPTKNALDGLDRWRETLTLILGNRTPDDGRALVSLGHLLGSYGRVDAAHVCYMFAKTPGLFGPPDDPQVTVALVGADHLRRRFDFNRDFDSILLTEVYEFARTVLASSTTGTSLPHLQAYKLCHAMILAENGFKSEAQQYCDTIASILTAKTKTSSYYHGLLFGSLEGLNERLRQAPKDGTGSWISKPSMDKVSGSLWNKFNQYVAGEDSDNASAVSGMAYESDIGPFAKIAGESPSLSRSPSSAEIYSPHNSGLGLVSAQTTNPGAPNSRYAPAGFHTPKAELSRRPSQEYQKSIYHPPRSSATHDIYSSRPGSSDEPTFVPSNIPPHQMPNVKNAHRPTAMPQSPPEDLPPGILPSVGSSAYQERNPVPLPSQITAPDFEPLAYPPYHDRPSSALPETSSMSSYVASSYQPSSYEPPASSGYEPPSYDPPSPEPDLPPTNNMREGPKKNSIMDDDNEDDFEARAAAMRKTEKARKDREADEAFRRAAEEDGESI